MPAAVTGISVDLVLGETAAFANGRMLDRRKIEMADLQRRAAHAEIRRQHQVGRFGRTAGEDHIGRLGAAQCGHLAPRALDRRRGRRDLRHARMIRIAEHVDGAQASPRALRGSSGAVAFQSR